MIDTIVVFFALWMMSPLDCGRLIHHFLIFFFFFELFLSRIPTGPICGTGGIQTFFSLLCFI